MPCRIDSSKASSKYSVTITAKSGARSLIWNSKIPWAKGIAPYLEASSLFRRKSRPRSAISSSC
ncbi:hypothetical protein ACFL4G_12505, partial [Thermodesulfobacteriota bacterium]